MNDEPDLTPFEKPRDPDAIPEETPFDTPKVKATREAEREYLEEHGETIDIDTPERHALREEIARKLYGEGAPKRERKLILVNGPPGSGKSEVKDDERLDDPDAFGGIEIDADEAKKQLPEYAGGKNTTAIHEESSVIAAMVLDRAFKAGDNIFHPVVGKRVGTPEQPGIRQIIETAREHGYEVTLRTLEMSPEESAANVVDRLEKKGRYVPPEYALHEVGERPSDVADALREIFRGDTNVSFERTES